MYPLDETAINNIIEEADIGDFIVAAYVVYYGRAPDPEGRNYWATNPKDYTLQQGINAFGDSDEYRENFGTFSTNELIHNIYQQAFGRDAYQADLDLYGPLLDSGETSLATIALTIASRASGDDLAVFLLKLEIATLFTDTLGNTVCDGIDYGSHTFSGSDDASLMREFMLTVTNPAMVDVYKVAATQMAYEHFLVGVPRCGTDVPVIPVVVDPDPVDPDPAIGAGDPDADVADPDLDLIGDPDTLIITPADNTAPRFLSGDFEQLNENVPKWNHVYDAQAVDSSGSIDVGVTYTLPTLLGDNDLFTIDGPGGKILFKNSPDYENPHDSDQNNIYSLVVAATDDAGNTATKDVTVKIVDVDENLVVPDPDPIVLDPFPDYIEEDGYVFLDISGKMGLPYSIFMEHLLPNATHHQVWIGGSGKMHLDDDDWDFEENFANGGSHYITEEMPTYHLYIDPAVDVFLA